MAVAVAEAQFTTKTKILLGNSRSKYVGTVKFGTEYATGGNTIGSDAAARYALPEVIDSLQITGAGGWDFALESGKVKVYGGAAAAKGAGAEAAAKTDLSGVTATFELIGPS
jgi:hypothetical protein